MLYGDLSSEEKARCEKHLQECAACRKEYVALGEVRRLLDQVPSPGVAVDLPHLYRLAAQRQAERVRRGRRFALAVSSAAALVAVLVLGLRLEAHVEAHQLVLRWGTPAPQPLPPPPPHEELLAPRAEVPAVRITDDGRLRVVNDILLALAENVQSLERRQQSDTMQLRARLQFLEDQDARRWADLKQTLDGLYLLSHKGD
jgi:hypothetical protein